MQGDLIVLVSTAAFQARINIWKIEQGGVKGREPYFGIVSIVCS